MASPLTGGSPGSERPHLVQLVLASKKALQHGEHLCSKARTLSTDSAQAAVDVLALDAKVRWVSRAVLEQLKVCLRFLACFIGSSKYQPKLATSIARSIEQKRAELETQVKVGWATHGHVINVDQWIIRRAGICYGTNVQEH